VNCGFGATGHDVEQLRPRAPGAGHRHDPGDELGVLSAAGGQERGLVDADGDHPGQAGGVVDERGAVLADRAHHGAPADPEAGRDGGDVQAVLADQPARLPPGPLSQ